MDELCLLYWSVAVAGKTSPSRTLGDSQLIQLGWVLGVGALTTPACCQLSDAVGTHTDCLLLPEQNAMFRVHIC